MGTLRENNFTPSNRRTHRPIFRAVDAKNMCTSRDVTLYAQQYKDFLVGYQELLKESFAQRSGSLVNQQVTTAYAAPRIADK